MIVQMKTHAQADRPAVQEAPHGRFSFFSSDTQQAITGSSWVSLFPDGNHDHIFQESHKARPEPSRPVWWVDVRDATEEDVGIIAEALSIHPLTAEDIAIREPREKVEVFKNYYLISFQTLASQTTESGERLGMPSSAVMYILVFQYGVATFSPSECGHVSRVRDRIRKMHDPSILSSDWICYALIDDIVDSFDPFTRAVEAESEAIEDQVFIARIDDVQELIPQVDVLRKKTTHIMRCLNGKVDVLNGFVKRCQAPDKLPIFPDGDLLLYLGDVQDHLVTTLSMLAHIDEIIGRSQGNCLAQLSATNLRVGLTINSAMSKVTLLATIFVPCHLVTGMFGMNVYVPGQDTPGLSWFFGIVGVFVAFMVVCMGIAAKFKLL
ncbi:putative magnesium and cobalt transport protein and translocase of inner membrane [Penicillium brasilianum]|uniref:Putative magnesium and cobalt transport protein and translocase of inner membrane n=1 Tax=Penicillium brasilianum TaxID=104259 RepID=A0A1S9RDH0_PENBI|nr:putative magnesium and cobalt transport protein and translocase of inner membrane [Penicillium brasilianum]